MKKSILLALSILTFNAWANPSCLADKSCFEYEGKLIDLRSEGKRSLDTLNNCDPLTQNCYLESSTASAPELSLKEFKKLVGHERSEYFIPIEKSDLMIMAGALSLGTIVFSHDREIMDYVQENKTEYSAPITTVGNLLGREAIVPMAAGAYFIGAVMRDGKLKKVGLFTVSAGLATQIVTEVFKKNFQRMRPNASSDPYDFFQDNNNSFFSGHTSGAFSLATVIAEVYKDKPIVPYLAYGAAALTAYARMHDNKHWPSDVLAGAVAGHLITKILIRTLENSEAIGKSGLIVIPDIGKDERGSTYTGFRVQYTGNHKPTPMQCGKYGLKGSDLISLCLEEAFIRSGN